MSPRPPASQPRAEIRDKQQITKGRSLSLRIFAWQALALAWLLGLLSPVGSALADSSARFLAFRVVQNGSERQLVGGGQILLRLRPGMRLSVDLTVLAERLHQLAFGGLRPNDISVRATKREATLIAHGRTLLTIEAVTAQRVKATPSGLATRWAHNLRSLLARPYVVLQPREVLRLPVGESRELRWGGTAAARLTFTVANSQIARAELTATKSSLRLQGLSAGDTRLTVLLPRDREDIALVVRPWAVHLVGPAQAEIASPPLPADDLRRVLRNAVLSVVRPMPETTIRLGEPRGAGLRFWVPLRAEGRDCFEVEREVPVRLKVIAPPRGKVEQLLVSNMPERFTKAGTLLQASLPGKATVRLLWHHANGAARPLRFVVRAMNLGATEARLFITEAATGPHHDEIFVGHQAATRFLALLDQGAGYVLRVPPGKICELYDVRCPVGGIVSGLAHLTSLTEQPLWLEILAADRWPTEAYFAAAPAAQNDDPPRCPWAFEAAKTAHLTYEVGGPWSFYAIGKEPSTNLTGQKLYGDYGVLYTIHITCRNPLAEPARCVLTLRGSGGIARATYYVNGQRGETGLLGPGNEEIIARFTLSTGEERQLTFVTMPQAGSNYPLTLTVRPAQQGE